MSFSYFDFSPAANVFQAEERAEGQEVGDQSGARLAPSENVWLDFNAAGDGRRHRLEEALRFLDEDSEQGFPAIPAKAGIHARRGV
ncbi:MAG TPA: hypothetical protein VF782_05630 [Allosphingosinicella sp.]|jgi:hypothetical protein